MKPIPYDVWLKAIRNWEEYHDNVQASHSEKFAIFTGRALSSYRYLDNDRNTNQVMVPDPEKFYLLASPHFRTLLRAYEIKYGPVYSSEQRTEQSS